MKHMFKIAVCNIIVCVFLFFFAKLEKDLQGPSGADDGEPRVPRAHQPASISPRPCELLHYSWQNAKCFVSVYCGVYFRLRNDLYCVGRGVKLYSLTHLWCIVFCTENFSGSVPVLEGPWILFCWNTMHEQKNRFSPFLCHIRQQSNEPFMYSDLSSFLRFQLSPVRCLSPVKCYWVNFSVLVIILLSWCTVWNLSVISSTVFIDICLGICCRYVKDTSS